MLLTISYVNRVCKWEGKVTKENCIKCKGGKWDYSLRASFSSIKPPVAWPLTASLMQVQIVVMATSPPELVPWQYRKLAICNRPFNLLMLIWLWVEVIFFTCMVVCTTRCNTSTHICRMHVKGDDLEYERMHKIFFSRKGECAGKEGEEVGNIVQRQNTKVKHLC